MPMPGTRGSTSGLTQDWDALLARRPVPVTPCVDAALRLKNGASGTRPLPESRGALPRRGSNSKSILAEQGDRARCGAAMDFEAPDSALDHGCAGLRC
jgi:hypothetical protein